MRTYDPRNYLGFGSTDIVPTKRVDTGYLETASDDWLTDFNGDGISDIAICITAELRRAVILDLDAPISHAMINLR